ncbi:MAG: hypothetical protein R8P61_06715 [Bacteroidia bacterium]|nr:hypothetical protein [Bacteroidia bacterium]
MNQHIKRDPLYSYSIMALLLGLGLFFSLIFLFPSLEFRENPQKDPAAQTLEKLRAKALQLKNPAGEKHGFIQGNKLIQIKQSRVVRIYMSPGKDSLYFAYPSGSLYIPLQKGPISATSNLDYYRFSQENKDKLDKVFLRSFNEVIFPSFRNYEDMLAEAKPDFIIGNSKEQKIALILNQLGISDEAELENLLNARQKPSYQEVIINSLAFLLKEKEEIYLEGGEFQDVAETKSLENPNDLLLAHMNKNLRAEIQTPSTYVPSQSNPWQAWFFPLFSALMFVPLGLSFFRLRKKKEPKEKANTPIGDTAKPIEKVQISSTNGSRKLGDRTRIFVHEIESAKDSKELSFILTENSRVAAHEIKEVSQILQQKIEKFQLALPNGSSHTHGQVEKIEVQIPQIASSETNGEQLGILNEILDKLQQKEGQNGLYTEISKLSHELERQGSDYKNFLQTQFNKQEEFLYKQLETEREKSFELEKTYQLLNQKYSALLGEKLGLDQESKLRGERLTSYENFISQLCLIISRSEIDNLLDDLKSFLLNSGEILNLPEKELKPLGEKLDQVNGVDQSILDIVDIRADIRKVIGSFVSYMDSHHKTELQKSWAKLSDKLSLHESFELQLKGESKLALGKLIDICKHLNKGSDKIQELEKLIHILVLDKNSKGEIQKHLKNAQLIEQATQPTKITIDKISTSLKQDKDVKLAFISLVDQVLALLTDLSIYQESGLHKLNFRPEVVKPLINGLIYQQIRLAISEESQNSLEELDKVLTELIPGLNTEKALSEYRIGPERVAKFGTMIDIYKQVIQSKGQNDLDADYIKNLYKGYGQMLKKLDRLDPLHLSEEEKVDFYTELFHLGLHSCDYLRYRSLPSIEIHEERLNVHLIRKTQTVKDLDPKSYKAFSFAPDISQASKVIRKLATELGIKELDGVLVNGVYLSPDVLK